MRKQKKSDLNMNEKKIDELINIKSRHISSANTEEILHDFKKAAEEYQKASNIELEIAWLFKKEKKDDLARLHMRSSISCAIKHVLMKDKRKV